MCLAQFRVFSRNGKAEHNYDAWSVPLFIFFVEKSVFLKHSRAHTHGKKCTLKCTLNAYVAGKICQVDCRTRPLKRSALLFDK